MFVRLAEVQVDAARRSKYLKERTTVYGWEKNSNAGWVFLW
jgi:hypothetical protein